MMVVSYAPPAIEILMLLARRYTNREIASQLVLSVRTVERHVFNLFAKTGLQNRWQAQPYVQRYLWARLHR
jgi:DNA-binding NarL/FixJ family response regulator